MELYKNIEVRHFANGMRLYVLPRPGCSLELHCAIMTGSMHEDEYLGCGLSHFLEHMLFQGCEGYPGTAAADTIARLGGDINAYTSFDRTVYHLRIAAEHFATAAEVLAAMVRKPLLDAKCFAAERDVILREYDRSADQVEHRIFERLMEQLFPRHPLRVPIIGRRELIAAVDRDMAARYHATRYTPERCFWVAVGGVDPDEVAGQLESLLGDWAPHRGRIVEAPLEPPSGFAGCDELVFPDQLARLAIGIRVPATVAPEEAELLFGVLGMGAGSRLVRELELKRNLAVELRCFMSMPGGIPVGGVCASATPSRLNRLHQALQKELSAVRRGALTAAEIEREKRQQYAEQLRQLREPAGIAADIVESVARSGVPDASPRRLARLEAISIDRIRECAEIVLNPENFSLVRQLDKPEKRHRAPAAGQPFECTETTLPGEAKFLHIQDASLPLVQLSVILPGGAIFEPPAAAGSSALFDALLLTGTRRRSEEEILRRLDATGADFEVSAGMNSLAITLNAPKKYFRKAAETFLEIVTEPRFAPEMFERERNRALENLSSALLSPVVAAMFTADKMLFSTHPYARGRSGDPESLRQLSGDALTGFYHSLLNPGRMIIGLAGDISTANATDIASSLAAAAAAAGSGVLPQLPPEPVFPESELRSEVPIAGREQTAVVRSIPGVALCEDDHYYFDILSKAENHLSSRLFKRVREDNSLAYSVGMKLFGGFHPGRMAFYAMTECGSRDKVVELFNEEILRLAESGLEEEEFCSAREGAVFASLREIESATAALHSAMLAVHYGRPATTAFTVADTLKNITREELNAAVRPCFHHAAGVLVCAGKV